MEAEESKEAADELRCASWIGSKYVAIGGSNSRLLRLCKLSVTKDVWTFTQCEDATAWDRIIGLVKRDESSPMIAISGVRVSATQHSIVSFGADFVLRVWSWTPSRAECVLQISLARLQKRATSLFNLCTKLSVCEVKEKLLVGVHVMTNADSIATLLTLNTKSNTFVEKDLINDDKDGELVSLCLDPNRNGIWSLYAPSNKLLCHRVAANSNLVQTHQVSLSASLEHTEDTLPDPLEKAYERSQRIASRNHLDSLADADREMIKTDLEVSVEEITLLSSDLSEYFIRRLSEVNRFTREAVASGLDDFAHKSNLNRQQGRRHLSWNNLFEHSKRIVELRVRQDLERQGQDQSEYAHHYAYLFRVLCWRELMDLCIAQQKECMRSLCIADGYESSLCGPIVLRIGLISTIWPMKCIAAGGRFDSIWQATKVMKLDEFPANDLMQRDIGLGEDRDWIYEDETEIRRTIEEYVDVLCSDSAQFSHAEVCACFDGVARPGRFFEELLGSEEDVEEESKQQREESIWISGLCSASIAHLRRRYQFIRKTTILLAYLHRSSVDWISSSQSQIFSMCLRKLVESRTLLRVASMRIVSLPHRGSVVVRRQQKPLRIGQSLLSIFVKSSLSSLMLGNNHAMRTTKSIRILQISNVSIVTSSLRKSTLLILDLLGSALRIHFVATQHLHISENVSLCSKLRVAIADSSLMVAQNTMRVVGTSKGIGNVDEIYEDASLNFVQAVLLMRKENKSSVRLCLDIAHAFNNLERSRHALDFAFLALDDKLISEDDAETVWSLIVDISLSDVMMSTLDDMSYYDIAYVAIQKRRSHKQEDMLRLLNLLVDRRHLKWIVSAHCASSLWHNSNCSILAVLRDRVRSNRVHSSIVEQLYATLIARGRYKEAAQQMFDLADSLDGLHDPENVRDGTMLSRRTRALLASMGALQLVPEDQAIMRRQRKDSQRRCVPIVLKDLRFDLAVASCRETLFRRGASNAKQCAILNPEACVSLAMSSEMYTVAFELARHFSGDEMVTKVIHNLTQECASLTMQRASSTDKDTASVEKKCESRWRLLRTLLEKSSSIVHKACVKAILDSSHIVPVPQWLEGYFSGSNKRHVVVQIPIQARRRVTLSAISEIMKRFGALEIEPQWLTSSAEKSVSVLFKSPIAARAAVNHTFDNGGPLVRFMDGTVSSGHKFGGEDACDPISLIRSYLDKSLISEACDVALEVLQSFESLSRRADNKQLPDQPLWIPETLLGELIWRACASCSVVYGTLNKWNDKKSAWYPRLCVGWRPDVESSFVLEFSPHMGEQDTGKIDLKDVQVRDVPSTSSLSEETKDDKPFSFEVRGENAQKHLFSANSAIEKRKWLLALKEMRGESFDDSSEAIVSLRTRIGMLRKLLSNVISRRPIFENLRFEKQRNLNLGI